MIVINSGSDDCLAVLPGTARSVELHISSNPRQMSGSSKSEETVKITAEVAESQIEQKFTQSKLYLAYNTTFSLIYSRNTLYSCFYMYILISNIEYTRLE